jgi:hypothetical protein
MLGFPGSCYRELGTVGTPTCPGQMFGDFAPAATWEYAFLRAALGPIRGWPLPPPNTPFWSLGNGQAAPKSQKPKKHKPGPGPHPTPGPPTPKP